MQSNLDQFRQELETAGLAFSYRLVSVLLVMGAIAVAILVVGLRYLSRDYTSKIGEIAAGMRQLAEGDHDFSIEGQHRDDEQIGRASCRARGCKDVEIREDAES